MNVLSNMQCAGQRGALIHFVALAYSVACAQPLPMLKNNVTPGQVQEFAVEVHVVREGSALTSPTVEARQSGELAIINLNRLGEGVVQRAWILRLNDSAITTSTENDAPVDAPTAFGLGVPGKSVRFLLDAGRGSDAPMVSTGGHAIYNVAFLMATDVGHWPANDPKPRDTWAAPFRADEFEGQRACRLLRMSSADRERTAVMDQDVSGQFLGRLAETTKLTAGRVELEWSLLEDGLIRSAADLTFETRDGGAQGHTKLTVTVQRREHRHLSAEERTAAVEQLDVLHPAIALYNDHRDMEAFEKLEGFSKKYPTSLWSPVVDDMLSRLNFERQVLGLPPQPDVLTRLGRLMEAWQSADLADHVEELAQIRERLRQLAQEHPEEVTNHTEDSDPSIRAAAHFCLAFSDSAEVEPLLISAVSDSHPRVRAWAMYGIAQRRDARLGARVFDKGLADADAVVRQRTCQAIRYCVDRTTEGRERWATGLLALMADDANADVRLFATRALRRFATPQHMAQLEAIEDRESVPEVRSEMRDLVIQVGGVPKSARRSQ